MADFLKKDGEIFAPERVQLEIAKAIGEKSIVSQIAGTSRTLTGDGMRGLTGGIPAASIVAEGALKPVADPMSMKTVGTEKVAVITVVSEEMLDDDAAVMQELQSVLPRSLALAIDKHILTEESTVIDTLSGVPEVSGATAIAGLTSGIAAVHAAGHVADNIVTSPALGGELISAVDSNGRPIFVPSYSDAIGQSFLGSKISTSRSLEEGAIVGDFSTSTFATVGSTKLKVTDQATVDGVSMWQTNQVAILAEIRFSFITPEPTAFARVGVKAAGK